MEGKELLTEIKNAKYLSTYVKPVEVSLTSYRKKENNHCVKLKF